MLALGKGILLCPFQRFALRGDEPRAELGMDIASAAGDIANRRDDLGVDGLLEDIAARTHGEGLPDVAGIVLHREDEHLQLGMLV